MARPTAALDDASCERGNDAYNGMYEGAGLVKREMWRVLIDAVSFWRG